MIINMTVFRSGVGRFIVIFQEILKNGQKEGVTLPKFLENLRAFFREVDEALINF